MEEDIKKAYDINIKQMEKKKYTLHFKAKHIYPFCEFEVVVDSETAKKYVYTDPLGCPLYWSIKEQHREFQLDDVGPTDLTDIYGNRYRHTYSSWSNHLLQTGRIHNLLVEVSRVVKIEDIKIVIKNHEMGLLKKMRPNATHGLSIENDTKVYRFTCKHEPGMFIVQKLNKVKQYWQQLGIITLADFIEESADVNAYFKSLENQ